VRCVTIVGGGLKENYKVGKNKSMCHVPCVIKNLNQIKNLNLSNHVSCHPSYVFTSLISARTRNVWRFISLEGVENTAGCHVSEGVVKIVKECIRMHMIIHTYKLVLHTYIIIYNYTFANMLLTGTLISNDVHLI
jgi:hypothetical protein